MLNRVYWYADNILAIEYEGDITANDLKQGRKQYDDMLDKSSQSEVHLLVDLTKRTSIDSSVLNFTSVRHYVSDNEKIGWILVVDPKPPSLVKFITSLLTKSNQQTFHIESSIEDAIAFLETET